MPGRDLALQSIGPGCTRSCEPRAYIRERTIWMRNDSIIRRREEWLTAWIDDDLVMMSSDSRYYLSLSGSGGRIWELLERPQSPSQLCEALAREFEITPDAARPEVLAFLDRLAERKAIDVISPAVE